MPDYNYHRLIERLDEMAKWQVTAAAAVTATKVSPIVRSLALPDTLRIWQQSLALTWHSISNQRSDSDRAKQLLLELDSVPEWRCEHPDSLISFVLKPLELIRFALETVAAELDGETGDNIGLSHILDIVDELDVAVSDYPDLISSTLEIRSAEKSSQMSLIATLAEHNSPSDELLSTLRQEGKSISILIGMALPVFCYGFVSAVCRGNV